MSGRRLKFYFEIDGPGFDEPCGMAIDLGQINDDGFTIEKYKELQKKLKSEVLELVGSSELADESKCRVISENEYEEKYGDE